MGNKLCLLNSVYDGTKSRVVLYFGKDAMGDSYDHVYKKFFYPYFVTDISFELVESFLSDFKKEILIKANGTKTKILAKNFITLQKVAKILQQATGKNIILIEPERQFLIRNNWSYYDCFYVSKDKILKINNQDYIQQAISKHILNLENKDKIKLIEPLTKKLMLSNLLKIKPTFPIKNDQILNLLLENEFFNYELFLKNTNNFYYKTNDTFFKDHINLDFSNVLPYLLTNKFNNVGYETLNCECCKPNSIFEKNILFSSLVSVEFNKAGFYFISCDNSWAKEYHNNSEKKENRENYKKQNKLNCYPVGPFTKGEKADVLLSDALNLLKNKEIKICKDNSKTQWTCKEKESFISKIINELLEKQKKIEESINISSVINYSSKSLKNSNNLENNPLYLQYLTEYSLINSLIEEIPKFLQHKNTKFYSQHLDNAIKSITYNTINEINKEQENLIINTNHLRLRNKKLLLKINQVFPKMNLPVPRLVLG